MPILSNFNPSKKGATAMKSKQVISKVLNDFEKRLVIFFYIVAGLGIGAILFQFAPAFRVSFGSGIFYEDVSGFSAFFGDIIYQPSTWGIIADLTIVLGALLSLLYAYSVQTKKHWRKKNVLIIFSLSFNIVAVVMLYVASATFITLNTLESMNYLWGFVCSGALVITAMFIEWFFVNRLNDKDA